MPKITIWQEMTPLAIQHKAVNLGQGFPSFPPPPLLLDELKRLIDDAACKPLDHQYTRSLGNLELVDALRAIYAKRLGRPAIGQNEIVITNGTTQGLNICFQAFINPGDEVIIFEPFYDAYTQDIQMAGGKVSFVPLIPSGQSANEWHFSVDTLKAAITPRTKIILVNTPQNVPGKVWTVSELRTVAELAVQHDLLVVADEVYMTLAYDGLQHVSMASLPRMWDRTVTLCSIGKTLSCTGWKVGWAVAPEPLALMINQVQAHQSFCIATPLQIAVGRALGNPSIEEFYQRLLSSYEGRRQLLCSVLEAAQLAAIAPSGGFFVLADISKVDESHYYNPDDTVYGKDWQFCRWLVITVGVCAIPTTAFCSVSSRPLYEKYVRFAFCKTEEEIGEAGVRLLNLSRYFAGAGSTDAE